MMEQDDLNFFMSVSEWLGSRFEVAWLQGCEVRGCEVRGCEVARLRGSKFSKYRLMTFFWTALYVVMARLRGCKVVIKNTGTKK